MARYRRNKFLTLVVKISKYCNLRCNYCYEYLELGNKARMPLDSIRRLMENIARHATERDLERVTLIWHGGEPLLVPLDYYEKILEMQQEAFVGTVKPNNAVQTNLTVMTDRHIEFLKSGKMFRGIGVSFDVYGNQRVDTQGKLRTDQVLRNMQTLIDETIPFGAISVLSRDTASQVVEIYRFYDQLGVHSRLLPFYMNATDEQVSRHALTFEEVTTALKRVFDAWMSSPTATPVDPIDEYIEYAVSYLRGRPSETYEKELDEGVFIVDLDGGTWGLSEAYDADYRYGNVFEQPFDQLLDAPSRARACREADDRIEQNCRTCPYFGHCPGYFAGDATPEQQALLKRSGCPVQNVVEHIIHRFKESGVDVEALAAASDKPANEALAVAR